MLIRDRLGSAIRSDYVLLESPYYANIGDTLIWEGELTFLRETAFKMLAYGSACTWDFRPLDASTTILLQGGGSFGDLWDGVQDFRIRVIERYSGNPIIVFPQTAFYQDDTRMSRDAARMAAHPDLTICARDQQSFDLLNRHFRNKILLVPDMAFYIDPSLLRRYATPHVVEKILYLKRTDKELDPSFDESKVPGPADVRDWPTLERKSFLMWVIYKLSGAVVRLRNKNIFPRISSLLAGTADRLAYNRLRRANMRAGVRLMSPYTTVVSTRLHGVIMAMLLDTERIVVLDNSYGKLSAFYDTWLAGTDGIRIERPPHSIKR